MIAAGRRNDGSLRHTSVLLAVLVALPRADGALAAADRQLRGQQMASGGAPGKYLKKKTSRNISKHLKTSHLLRQYEPIPTAAALVAISRPQP
eukprot:SAG31_NODE_1076_length_10037_cov_8.357818_6_plen_93_part_00